MALRDGMNRSQIGGRVGGVRSRRADMHQKAGEQGRSEVGQPPRGVSRLPGLIHMCGVGRRLRRGIGSRGRGVGFRGESVWMGLVNHWTPSDMNVGTRTSISLLPPQTMFVLHSPCLHRPPRTCVLFPRGPEAPVLCVWFIRLRDSC